MTENNDDLIAERDKLQAAVARLRVERETGVPAELWTKAILPRKSRSLPPTFWLGRPPPSQRRGRRLRQQRRPQAWAR